MFSEGNSFQVQIQNRAARRINLISETDLWNGGRKALLPATQLFNVAVQFFVCCSAASGKKRLRPYCRKVNVVVQLLQRDFPKAATSFSLVACCGVGVLRGWGLGFAEYRAILARYPSKSKH